MRVLFGSLLASTLALTVHAAAEEPTCMAQDPSGVSCHDEDAPPPPPPPCSIWADLRGWTLAGEGQLNRGDPIGEPDVVIPWYNHDPWAWTAWHRFQLFFERLLVDENDNYSPVQDSHVFAPGLNGYPFQCHKSLANLNVTDPSVKHHVSSLHMEGEQDTSSFEATQFANYALHQNVPVTANRGIVTSDPLFTNCRYPDMSQTTTIEEFPRLPLQFLEEEVGTCMDVIRPAPSSDVGMGAFSKYAWEEGDWLVHSPVAHLLRSELQNQTSKENELLLNYCYGHSQTPLLLLPLAPGVNYINHDGKNPNIKLVWRDESVKERLFNKPTREMFARGETPLFFVAYEALRDIKAGEELLMDYGKEWEEAWATYVQDCGGQDQLTTCEQSAFRHEIGVPENFFPQEWLDEEVMESANNYTWDVSPLDPGQVRQITVKETGQRPMSYGHRVGLPKGFSEKLLDYANRIGITNIMKKYITGGEPLELGETERHQINGGIWWVKRFDSEWHSNMHYITPDDEGSNDEFMEALYDAGFETVLKGVGEHFGLDGLLCYYPSFIAVSHCKGSFPHVDAEHTGGKAFNMIFPVLQANNDLPELMLGEDGFGSLVIPYRYEPEAAILLGDDGVHHTSPTDYRATKEMRLVISIYMADINEENRWAVHWDEGMDPPYPRIEERMPYLMRNAGKDWRKAD